jgi:AmiR/NasT family two-component response regulator
MAYISKPFREGDVSPAVQLAVSQFLERSALAERVSRLKEQLDARKVIERAKGLLMSKEGLSEANAYRRLQKISMDKNKTMKEVAEAVILMLE